MNKNNPFQDAPLPELLAAQADGEISGADVERVQAWLALHPSAAADLSIQKRLGWRHSRLWHLSSAGSPPAHIWAATLARIESESRNPKPMPAVRPPLRTSRRRLLAALSATAAMALLAALVLPSLTGTSTPSNPAIDAFAVASNDDVEILRIFEVDTDGIVVGELPLKRPLMLAAVEDVSGLNIVKDVDGMMPMVAMAPGPNAPMIVAPMAGK